MGVSKFYHVSPSRHSPWAGGSENELTDAQLAAIRTRGATLTAGRRRTGVGIVNYWITVPLQGRLGDVPRSARIKCVTIAASRDRKRLLVIAPDGTEQWVDWK